MEYLLQNLQNLNDRIARECDACGRDRSEIRLIAVSKTHPVEKIRAIAAYGQHWFGENYEDELRAKASALKDSNIRWSYIGTLQSNKISKLMEHADEIQTVASEKHARLIEKYAQTHGKKKFPVFICVNSENEAQKTGISWEQLAGLRDFILHDCPSLDLQGLMAIPPASYSDPKFPNTIPDLYRRIADESKRIGQGQLSLGMTHDLGLAIRAGSTIIRVGTAIFGERVAP